MISLTNHDSSEVAVRSLYFTQNYKPSAMWPSIGGIWWVMVGYGGFLSHPEICFFSVFATLTHFK